ncbi:hypothetical protein [Promicromonospora soli]
MSTPSGWKCTSAPRFSFVAGVNGSGEFSRRRRTSSGSVTTTKRRSPSRSTSGAPP